MKKLIVLATVFACEEESLVSGNNSDCVEKINPEVVCTAQYAPVCGCNGKTYGNACVGGKHRTTPYKLKTLTC